MSHSSSSLQPLSIGNVVSAALQLYRSHLKSYLAISVLGHLWILVPIYGWAKYAQMHGVLARLAFQELVNEPESVDTVRRKLQPLMWSFFGVGLWLMGAYLLFALGCGIVASILAPALAKVFGPVGSFLVMGLFFVALLLGIIRVYSRLVVAEVPLAVEENVNGAQSVKRSWEITKSAIGRIQGVVFVAFLVSLPLVAVFNYLPRSIQLGMSVQSPLYALLKNTSGLTSLLGGALIMPFWQSLKAVLYFDLRNRREGLGLKLRDR